MFRATKEIDNYTNAVAQFPVRARFLFALSATFAKSAARRT